MVNSHKAPREKKLSCKHKDEMSGISGKKWKADLTSILEELDLSQYKKMLEYLEIPKGRKRSMSKEKMPQEIIEYYGLEESISAIQDIMDQIPRKDYRVQDLLRPHVDKLKNKHEKESQGKKRKRVPDEDEESSAADQQRSSQPVKKRNTESWRKPISDLKSSSQLLDSDAITGKAVQKSGQRTYQTKDKGKKDFFYLALADDTASVKVMVYGKERYKEIKEGHFYLFRKLMRDEKGFKVTKVSKVSETHSFQVPEEFEMEAQKLIYSESPVCTVAKAKLSADKTEVSVDGTVTEIDPVEQVKVKDERKKAKKLNFQLKDDTGSIRICMWGEHTEQCRGLSVGDVVKVTNMKISQYYETVSLNSTGSTRIHKVQSAGIQNVRIEIIGIIKATKKETHLEAEFNQQVHTFMVTSPLLAKAFGINLDGDFKQSLIGKMPLSGDSVIKGSKIKKITVAEKM